MNQTFKLHVLCHTMQALCTGGEFSEGGCRPLPASWMAASAASLTATVSCDSISPSYKVVPYYAMLQASLQRDPGVEGADQIRPTYANAGLVQCFRLSISVVGRGNVLVSRYLWPKSIADILSITRFTSIGDNSIDI